MELTFLGTGSAFAQDAFNAGYILDRRVLIDAGNPAHVLIPRTGHSTGLIELALITHQHADHTFGLPFVMASRAIDHPDAPPLTIAGPPGFERYMSDLLSLAWGKKLHGLVWGRLAPRFVELDGGDDVELAGFAIHAEEVVHVPDIPCRGYALSRDGVRFAFSGDSGVCPGLDRLVERSDHVLLEMTGPANDPSHLSRDAVEQIVRANPDKRFYLTHLSSRDPVPGARIANDLETVELEPPSP
jgi:ribonuclease BN (tRNA processing enzyme)